MAGGYRSYTGQWLGGASALGRGDGYTSLLAFWIGGASGSAAVVVPPVVDQSSGGIWPFREFRRLKVTAGATALSLVTHKGSVTVSRSLPSVSLSLTVRTNSVHIDKTTHVSALSIELAALSATASVQLRDGTVELHRTATADTATVNVTLGTAAISASCVMTVSGNALTITTGGVRAMITTVTPITRKAAARSRQRPTMQIDGDLYELIYADKV